MNSYFVLKRRLMESSAARSPRLDNTRLGDRALYQFEQYSNGTLANVSKVKYYGDDVWRQRGGWYETFGKCLTQL